MNLESLPPGIIPVVAVLVAAIVGVILWRLFKLAMKVVAFVVFLTILTGVVLWWQPGLIGIGRSVVEDQVGPLPSVEEAMKGAVDDAVDRASDEVKKRAKAEADKAIDDAVEKAKRDATGTP